MHFLPCDIGGSVWVRVWLRATNGLFLWFPASFRADLRTDLYKQGEIPTCLPSCPIGQWSECSHGLRGVLGLRTGRVMCIFLPCDNKTSRVLGVTTTSNNHSRTQQSKVIEKQ